MTKSYILAFFSLIASVTTDRGTVRPNTVGAIDTAQITALKEDFRQIRDTAILLRLEIANK